METIIQQIVGKMARNSLEYFDSNGLGALDAMAERLKAISEEAAREMLAAFIAEADRAIAEARDERLMDGIRVRKSRVPRELVTALGPFRYERTYFDMPEGRAYILDGILGVGAYDRVDAGVGARLAGEAARQSFGRAAEAAARGLVSRQTAKNKAARVRDVAHVPERAPLTPPAVHIFADEDHVSLQNGKTAALPLVTVCGGKRAVHGGRNALADAFHAHGHGISPEKLWERVYALCAEKYDMAEVKEIYLYGDGAAWISRAFDVFPGARHVLDAFHYKSRMKALLAGDVCGRHAGRAHAAVRNGDREGFAALVGEMAAGLEAAMPEGRERARRIKALKEHGGYVLAHWEAVMNMRLPGSVGSCTEAMVSHVLSERFSRNPMGWSDKGLGKIATIRVYMKNGGKITASDMTARPGGAVPDKYGEIVRKQQKEALEGMKDWSLFDAAWQPSGKVTGTKVALDALGKRRKIS